MFKLSYRLQVNLQQWSNDIPVAIGLVRGIGSTYLCQGGDGAQPSIEVPVPFVN